jgi:hypothetical protein
MSSHLVQVDAALRNRSITPTVQILETKLKAEPVLLLWRRLIDLTVEEATQTRFGEPTDNAILARWWIEQADDLDAKGHAFRATFERACLLLRLDAAAERKGLLREIDEAVRRACLRYAAKRLELRRRAVLTTARAANLMTQSFALLLVSQVEYEDVAGINRPDPPRWEQRKKHGRSRSRAAAAIDTTASDALHTAGARVGGGVSVSARPSGSSLDFAARG